MRVIDVLGAMGRLCGLVCLLVVPWPGSAAADAPSPPPAVPAPVATFAPDSTARFEFGANDAKLTLVVTGLDKAATASPLGDVHDVPVGGTSVPVRIDELKQLKGATTRFYELTFAVKDVPRNTSQQHTLAFTLAGKDTTLQYTLSNVPLSTYSLVVKPPSSAIAIDRGDWIPIGVVVGPVPATAVKLLQTHPIEKNTSHLISKTGLRLCKDHGVTCDDGNGLALAAYSANQLWLGPVDTVGSFPGQTVTIASAQKPDGDSASLSVSVSSLGHKLLGILAIVLGVFVASIVAVYVRGLIGRDQAYLPVLALRRTLEALGRERDALAGIDTPYTRDRIAEQYAKLADDKLQPQGLPPAIPLPWTIPGAPDIDKFRAYVQAVSNWTAVLGATVPALTYVVTKWSDWPSVPEKKAAVAKAVRGLDTIAQPGTAPALADAQKSVVAIRTEIDTPLTKSLAAAEEQPPAAPRPVTERDVRVEIALLSLVSWFVIGVLTTTVGAYVLLFSAAGAGFGTPADYLLAFFWGLGLPAASQLATATNATVTNTFKVTTPP